MDNLMQGFGVFLGVLAGTAVTILAGLFLQSRKQKQQEGNLRFEFELNIHRIDGWLEDLTRYRNAINGDALHTFFGYFDLSKVIYPTANAMFLSGTLYKKLSLDQIGKLQVLFATFSLGGEQFMNNQMTKTKQAFEQCRSSNDMEPWTTELKPEAVANVDFWEETFQEHRTTLDQIVQSLPSTVSG
ncbi:MAG: hypothetical protein IH983_07960 [Planctomycetes bacterium]|nr:hypothetical protein [Planctomycetota bacterium]